MLDPPQKIGDKSSRKLSRQERSALAEEKAVAAERQQTIRWRKQLGMKALSILGYCLIVVLGVGLGLYGRKLLALVDRFLRSRYAPPSAV